MHNLIKVLIFFTLLAFETNVIAEEKMRNDMKSAILKGCVNAGKKEEALKNINIDEYCTCTTNTIIDDMNDDELKQVFFGKGEALMQKKMKSSASMCMSTNSGIGPYLRNSFYKGCVEKPASDDIMLNKTAYCECAANKLTVNLSQQDIQDMWDIGQGTEMMETNISNKLMSVSAECLNQVIK